MMNIQFMKAENAVTVKHPWTGKDELAYVPDFDELVKNASCEEEIKAIRETEESLKSGKSLFKGFAFQIVYMSYEKALVITDRKTLKQEWVMMWQMMQHPWIEGMTKEQMIEKIERMYR